MQPCRVHPTPPRAACQLVGGSTTKFVCEWGPGTFTPLDVQTVTFEMQSSVAGQTIVNSATVSTTAPGVKPESDSDEAVICADCEPVRRACSLGTACFACEMQVLGMCSLRMPSTHMHAPPTPQRPVVSVAKSLVGSSPKTAGEEFSWRITPRLVSGSATSVLLVDYIDPASGIEFTSVTPAAGSAYECAAAGL